MIVECHQQCDACYNCLHRGKCHWDSARKCMVRECTCCDTCKHMRREYAYSEEIECFLYLCTRRGLEIPIEYLRLKYCDEWEGRE